MATVTETDSRWRIGAFVPLVGAAIFAPLAWGCVTAGTEQVLWSILALACLIGLPGYFFAREGAPLIDCRSLPVLLWGLAVAMVWISFFNARSYYDELVWQFQPLADHQEFLPGTSDAAATLPVAIRTTVMAAAFLLLLRVLSDRHLRWKLIAAVALTGAGVAVAGLWLKASGSNSLLFSSKEYNSGWPFAVFRYHGHAAAFLNMSWPAALGLLMRSMVSHSHVRWRPLWIVSVVVILAAVFANSSKGGHAVAVVGMALAVVLLWRPVHQLKKSVSKAALWGGGLTFAGVIAVAGILGGSVTVQRWSAVVGERGAVDGRLEAYRYAIEMVRDAGAFGFGPGTFGLKFPTYTGGVLERYWEHAHQDYLQAIIEWGWLGSILWFGLFGGAVVIGLRKAFFRERSGLCLSTRVALLATVMICLHSAFDFPLQIPSLQWLACIWLACLWKRDTRDPVRSGEVERRRGKGRADRPAALPAAAVQ